MAKEQQVNKARAQTNLHEQARLDRSLSPLEVSIFITGLFCLVGFGAAADVSASCLAVGDGLKGSLSDELPFHFSQTSKQSDEDRCELPQSFGVDESIGGSDVDASFLEVMKPVDDYTLGSSETIQLRHHQLIALHHG